MRDTVGVSIASELHRTSRIVLTPVAFADPPLLAAVGVHQPFALRAIVEVITDGGVSGLGETYADEAHLVRSRRAADALLGVEVFDTNELASRVGRVTRSDDQVGGHGMALVLL